MVGGEGELKKHLFINGKQMETKEYAPLYSPYTRKKIAEVAVASREQVKQAITVADEAKSVIANMPAYQRAEILENVVNLLKEQVNQAT